MGGTGGSGGGTHISYNDITPEISCNDLSFEVILNSPDPTILNTLKVNQKLNISMDPKTGAVIAIYKGKYVGAITHQYLSKLLDCMNNGNEFSAVIISIIGGACNVLVKKK